MSREGKGYGEEKYISDYCVVDLETTGIFISSASIIEISAIKVRDNQVIDEFSTLVNPGRHIPAEASAVNNITDEMVKDAPNLDMVIDSFLAFIGDDVIVGYNNAGFDVNMLYDAVLKLRGTFFSNNYIDIMHAARRSIMGLESYRLEAVSKYYGLDTTGEHRALKDCYLTKSCYDNLYFDYGDEAFVKKDHKGYQAGPGLRYSSETLALQELERLLEGIIADGEVSLSEFSELKTWMEAHRDLQGNYPFDRVFIALDKVLEDGRVTAEELEDLQIMFSDFVDPVKSCGCHEDICTLHGKHVCVTGDFNYGSRNSVFSLIESVGGIIDKSVKKATDYVVVGSNGSENWKTNHYGSKIQKALEMIEKGADIKIVEEDSFVPAVQQIIESGEVLEESVVEDENVSTSD